MRSRPPSPMPPASNPAHASSEARDRELMLLRAAARIAGVGGWEFDPTTQAMSWTDEVYRIHDLDRATFSPTLDSLLSLYPSPSRSAIESAVRQAIANGLAWDIELPLFTPRGRSVRVRARGEPQMHEGRCMRLTGSFEEVSAARTVQGMDEALELDLRKLALVAQHTHDVLMMTDGDDRIEWVNRRFVDVTGHSPAEANGHTPRELLNRPPSEPGTSHRELQERPGGASRAVELKLYRRDGTPFWAEVDVLPVVDQAGRTRQHIHVLRDITARKEAEAQRAFLRDRFATLAAGAGIGYSERTLDTGVDSWDAQCFRLHGLPPGVQAPSRENLESMVLAEDRDRLRRGYESLRAHATPIDIDYRIRKPDGAVAWIHLRARHERGADGGAAVAAAMLMDVTDRKQAEARADQLSRRLTLATRAAGVAQWELNLRNDEAHWNDEAFALYGLDPGGPAPTRAAWHDRFVHPDDRTRQQALAEVATRTGFPYDHEHRIVRADGAVRWVHSRASIVLGADGRPERALGVTIDITERKATEQHLRATLARLQLASAGSGVGIFERALDRDDAYWSEECFHLYGLQPSTRAPTWDELIRIVHPDDRELFRRQWEVLRQSEHFVDSEFRIVRPQGSAEPRERWLLTRGRLESAGDGRPERVVGVAIDITERKRAEMQARELGDWLRLTAAMIGMGTWQRDVATGVFEWDGALKRIFGLPEDGPTPAFDAYLAMVVPQDRDAVLALRTAVPAAGQTNEVSYSIRRADGQIRHLLLRRATQFDHAGVPQRIRGVAIDITELRRAQETLQGARDRLSLATQASRIATWERDLASDVGQWDPLLFRMCGMPLADTAPPTADVLKLVHPDDLAHVVESMQRAQRSSVAQEWEHRIVRPNGVICHLLTRAHMQPGTDGGPARLVGATLDVTDSRRTAGQLREALTRLRLTTEAAGVGTFERNLVTGEARWDETMRRLWGVPHDTPVPTLDAALAMVLPQDRAATRAALELMIESDHAMDFDYRVGRADGVTVVLNTRARVEHKDDGTPLRIVGATLDVTANRQAQARLREFDEWMRLAGQATGVGFFRLTPDDAAVFADRQTRLHYGLDPESPMPGYEDVKRNVLPEDVQLLDAARAQSLTAPGPVEAEYRVRDPASGAIRHLFTRRVRIDTGPSSDVVGAVIDVTESRTAQRALAAASERLALATRTAGVGIWEWNPATGDEVWDARMREIYGIGDPAWKPSLEHWRALVHPDDRERATRPFTVELEHLSGGESEHRIVRPDGEIRTVLGSFVVERDGAGVPVRLLGTDLDITEARRAQSERDALSLRLDLMAREVGIGVWDWDCARNLSSWSDQMYALFGRARETFSDLAWPEAVHPDDRARTYADLRAALRQGSIFQSQFRAVWPDGSLRWIASRGRVERDAGGKAQRIVGVGWDVSDLFRADVERRQLAERINMAAAGAGIGFWHFVVDTRTPYADAQTLALYGRTREQDPDFARHWLRHVHEDDRARMATMTARLTQNDEPMETEFRVVWPDGRIRHLAARAHRSVDAGGRGAVVNGVNWDITEHKMTESAVRAKETAERASAAKSEFLSRMSHELRTPLNAILGFAQILEIDAKHPLDDSQRTRLAHIQKAGWHLLALINEILDLSRIEAGKAQLTMSAVSVGEVIDECLSLMSTDASRGHVALHHAAAADSPTHAWADRVRVKQVLLNLLSNAVKYNRDGGEVRVVTRSSDHGQVIIGVRDTGPGLSAAQLDEIFQPFNRLGLETAPIEGTGIGLTISLKLAEQMGGALDVSSEVGVGSEFRLTLQAAVTLTRFAHGAPHLARADVTGSVLYVEDNPDNVSVVRDLLSLRPGVRLFTAPDGATARVLAAVCQPDLALLDLRLPDTDGITLIAELHAAAATRDVPCVAVSANAAPSDIAAVRHAGFVDFWPKPVNVDQLLSGIDHWLTRQPTPAPTSAT